ncbi:MAG: hypothetical protein Q9174_001500 [Haloplaca sp. 1 TL-2023]
MENKRGGSSPVVQAADTATDESAALSVDIPQSRLLRLPLELRRKIYAYLLDTKHVRSRRVRQYQSRVIDGFLRLKAHSPPFEICTALFRINKSLHQEAIDFFYSSNMFIRLSLFNDDVNWTESLVEETQLPFVCTNPDLVANIEGHALDVRLIQEKSKILRCQAVFPAHFLHRLVDFLRTMCDTVPKWGKEHAIHLYMRQRYSISPMAAENVVLEPWRSLHGLDSAVVGSSLVGADYANGLRSAMISQFNAQRWLQSVVKMKDDGLRELSRGQIQSAIDTFSQSPQFSQAINKLRYQAELKVAQCILSDLTKPEFAGASGFDELWKNAFLSAFRATTLCEDRRAQIVWTGCAPHIPENKASAYSTAERNEARLCQAGILTEVGEHNMAILELQAALEEDPDDTRIRNARDKASKKFDSRQQMGARLRALGVPGF